jgi:geranylgeranyl diphosphate synthase type II
MDAYGSLEYGRRVAHALAGVAQYECASLYAGFPDSPDRRFIEALPVLGARAS